MTPVPLELPLRPAEAAQLGHLILDHAERKPLSEEVRHRLAARASALRLESVTPYFGSLERDPVHPSAYYLAVDGLKVDGLNGEPLLLYLALATAPTSSIFYKPLLIGRTKRANGPEMVINATPFGPFDHENLEKFLVKVDTAFLPRPQGSRTAIAVGSVHPEKAFPAAFDAFRAILKRTGKNLAAISVPAEVLAGGATGRDVFSAGSWAAIRAGWREGYGATIDIQLAGETLESAREAVRRSPGFSGFSVDPSSLFHPEADRRLASPWSDAAVEDKFEQSFTAEERGWILDEFARPFDLAGVIYEFSPPEVLRLAVQFGRGLRATAQLREIIRQTRSVMKVGKSFDLEMQLEGAHHATTPTDLLFCLHWLRARGQAAQLASPRLGSVDEMTRHLGELAAIARYFQCTLSIGGRAEHGPEVLEQIARATERRLHYRISGELADRPGYINFLAGHLVG